MTCEGYVDGEWYAHQGVQVIEWPALENCVTIDAEACDELRAVFHMLGEQTGQSEPAKPWPFPTGRAPEKQPEPPPPLVITNHFKISGLTDRRTQEQIAASWTRRWDELCRAKFDNVVNFPAQPQAASATQPSEPQVRSRSAAAKSPLNGLLTEQSGRYCGLGFNGEE